MTSAIRELAYAPILYGLRRRRGTDVWYVLRQRGDGRLDGWTNRYLMGHRDGGWFEGETRESIAGVVALCNADELVRDETCRGRALDEVDPDYVATAPVPLHARAAREFAKMGPRDLQLPRKNVVALTGAQRATLWMACHASAPLGTGCVDCTIDRYPCPACLAVALAERGRPGV